MKYPVLQILQYMMQNFYWHFHINCHYEIKYLYFVLEAVIDFYWNTKSLNDEVQTILNGCLWIFYNYAGNKLMFYVGVIVPCFHLLSTSAPLFIFYVVLLNNLCMCIYILFLHLVFSVWVVYIYTFVENYSL